jgi:histidyl-tRNA synthetase
MGSGSPLVETEVLSAVCEVLSRLGFEGFSVRLNHRLVLSGLLNAAGVESSQHNDALIALDKLDKIGVDGVRQEFIARGISAQAAENCLASFEADKAERPTDTLQRLRSVLGETDSAIANLEAIVSLSQATGVGKRLRIDLSLARGLSYYTGAIMEIAVPDLAGSLGGGGRYDNLVGMFLGKDVPACGFSLGLERIIVVMTERGMFPPEVAGGVVDVMVTLWNESARADSIALAGELRANGLRVDVYPDADKLGKQFKYASSRNVAFVAIVGDDERAQGNVSVKDLRSGDQQTVARSEVAPFIRARRS